MDNVPLPVVEKGTGRFDEVPVPARPPPSSPAKRMNRDRRKIASRTLANHVRLDTERGHLGQKLPGGSLHATPAWVEALDEKGGFHLRSCRAMDAVLRSTRRSKSFCSTSRRVTPRYSRKKYRRIAREKNRTAE